MNEFAEFLKEVKEGKQEVNDTSWYKFDNPLIITNGREIKLMVEFSKELDIEFRKMFWGK